MRAYIDLIYISALTNRWLSAIYNLLLLRFNLLFLRFVIFFTILFVFLFYLLYLCINFNSLHMFVISSTPQIFFLSNYYFRDKATALAFIDSLKPFFKDYVFRITEPSLVSKSRKVNTYSASVARILDSVLPDLFNF